MQVGFEPPGRLEREPQGVTWAGIDPVVDIGAEAEKLAARIMLDLKLDGEEWDFFDD